MKTLIINFLLLTIGYTAYADQSDAHNTIYTKKIKRIINAINVGDFLSEEEYLKMLQTACKRNACNSVEKETVIDVGQQIIHCKIEHLKVHGIENADAISICNSTNAMIGCDSLATPLLRKMCYTGNNYSLQVLKNKEYRLLNRVPASKEN